MKETEDRHEHMHIERSDIDHLSFSERLVEQQVFFEYLLWGKAPQPFIRIKVAVQTDTKNIYKEKKGKKLPTAKHPYLLYNKEIIQLKSCGLIQSFTQWASNDISCMNLHLQALKVALSALKVLPFLKIQIFHAAVSITSTKKGCVKLDLACRIHCRISEPPDQSIPK